MFEGISLLEFYRDFSDDDKCHQYLFDLKWKDGYRCRKCGCDKYHKGKTKYHLRCSKCAYGESPTAHTIFHKVKIPLSKAFAMAFRIVVRKKGMSTLELSREVKVNKKSSWLFKRKMQEVMYERKNREASKVAQSKVVRLGGAEGEFFSKFRGQEKSVEIKIENSSDGRIGFAYGEVINVASQQSLQPFIDNQFDNTISANLPTKEQEGINEKQEGINDYSKIKQVSAIQIIILNLKNWMRGIHHHCSERFVGGYIDEFFFRFNRRNQLETILHQLLVGCIFHEPYFYRPVEP